MLPDLPNEIWQTVFTFAALDLEHTVETWVHGRQVSRRWRSLFAETYLDVLIRAAGRCNIFYGRYDADILGQRKVLMLELFFDRMDPADRTRCIFKEDPRATGRPQTGVSPRFRRVYDSTKNKLWRRSMKEYIGRHAAIEGRGGRFDKPPHVISIYGLSNDSTLPGLEFNIAKQEISFEWEPMLAAFFSEQHELNTRNAGGMAHTAEIAQLTEQLRQPGIGQLQKMLATKKIQDIVAARQSILIDVRRQRIRKHLRACEQMPFIIDECEEVAAVQRIVTANGAGTARDCTESDVESDIDEEYDIIHAESFSHEEAFSSGSDISLSDADMDEYVALSDID